MLDLYTCIIFCIILSDLVSHLYFHDYWYLRLLRHVLSWLHDILGHTMLFHLVISSSCEPVTMWHDSYLSRMSHVHYIHVTPCMHGLIVHDLSFWLFLLLLLPLVIDTAKHTILMSYLLLQHLHILFYCFFSFVCPYWSACDRPLL